MTDIRSQLEFILLRLYESELGFYPDQFKDKNLYDLAFKSKAIKNNYKGEKINTYKPKIGSDGLADYTLDPVVFFLDIENAFDIQIKDDDAEKISTISDLTELILAKRKEMIYIHKKYYDSLLKSKNIELLIVGKDPFKNGATGIPFCKETLQEQSDERSSGYYVLKGLGVDIKSEKGNPEDIFFNLLNKEGIGFINASYFFLNDKAPEEYHLNISNFLNYDIFRKSRKIVATNSGLKLLKRRTKYQSKTFDKLTKYNVKIMPRKIDNRFIPVIHPSGKNIREDEHKLVWQQSGGLLKKLKKQVA